MGMLDGRVALITGGAGGIGGAAADVMAREGAAVAVADADGAAAADKAAELREQGARAIAVTLDVTDRDRWVRAVETVEDEFGSLDVLFNNAGVGSTRDPETGATYRLHELAPEDWRRVIDVNLTGVWLGIQAAVPAMRRARGGSIINTASIASFVGSRVSAYGTSKGGVRALTMSAAVNLAPDGIRVNSVHPGVIVTGMTRALLGEDASQAATLARYPQGRLGEPVDIAEGVAYLASDRAAFVTGSALVIDGGFLAW